MTDPNATRAADTPPPACSAAVDVYEGNKLSRPGVRSCYNCRHQRLGVYDKPCVDCLGSSVSNRSHFEAELPNNAVSGQEPAR